MSAAGEAVLAVAYGEVGVTEDPPGSNAVKYWVPWTGSNYGYGPWCAAFVSWCQSMAGYAPCWVDGPQGFTLVSNGTLHSYSTGGDGATGLEAQRTAELQPGDTVLFSWENWEWRGGVPTCVGEWDGYVAGDHTGIFAYWVDQGVGRFAAVEGNTSASSWDNGGAVLLREDRYTSQVCGWWRQESIAGGGGPTQPEELFTVSQYDDIMGKLGEVITRTDWILKACHKSRLIDAHGAWWVTDFIGVTPAASPDMVVMLQQLGYLDNDVDNSGNPIPQGCPDSVFDNLVRYDLLTRK